MKISDYIDSYKRGTVQITNGVSYNLEDVIADDFLSVNAMFSEPNFSDGTPKEYFDIGRILSTRLKASTDIDTKDIEMIAENSPAVGVTDLIKGAVRHQLKVQDWGEKFNQVRDELIDFGHVIIKKVNNETKIVDLRNVVRPPHVMDIQESGICERVFLTWDDVLANKKNWQAHWDDILAIKEKLKKENKTYFTTYELWTMDDFEVKGAEKFTKGCIVYLDRSLLEEDSDNSVDSWSPYLELERYPTPEKEKIRSKKQLKQLREQGYIGKDEDTEPIYPYDEQRFVTIQGRWKGAGVHEICRPLQKAYNRNMNNKLRFDELNHKGVTVLTKTATGKGKSLSQDALNSLEYGGVVAIKNDEQLNRLNFGNLIGEFLQTADKFFELARQMVGVTAQGVGEELPASMPATTAAINQQVAKTTYDVVIEQQSLLWARYFRRFELNSILEDITLEEWAKIEGDPRDLEELEENYIDNLAKDRITKALNENPDVKIDLFNRYGWRSDFPQEELEMVKEAIRQARQKMGGIRFAQIKKDLIKDAEFNIAFYVNNEAFDKISKIKELQMLRQEALSNPNSSLSAEQLEEAILDLMNLGGKRFKKTEKEKQALIMAMQQQQIPQTESVPEQVPTPV
jgi:hypothetical protein